jgi:hypothetical protein
MTRYYILSQKKLPQHSALQWTWLLVVEDGIIAWSQAFNLHFKEWWPGIFDGEELDKVYRPELYTLTPF